MDTFWLILLGFIVGWVITMFLWIVISDWLETRRMYKRLKEYKKVLKEKYGEGEVIID